MGFLAVTAWALPQPSDFPFQVGERLFYEATFNGIVAGRATLEVIAIDTVDNAPSFHIRYSLDGNALLNRIYAIHDRIDVWVDQAQLFTRKVTKAIQEGPYRKSFASNLDYGRRIATTSEGTIPLSGPVRDPYTLFFFLRTARLDVTPPMVLETLDETALTSLEIHRLANERIEVPAGEFDCLVIHPRRAGRALFKSKGEMTIWLSDDALRVPVRISSRTSFGAMTLRLKKIRPGNASP